MDVASIALSNEELMRLFIAVVLLIFSGQSLGYLFDRFGMPKVIGEIFGGLLLGPTLLGFFAPNLYTWIFNAFAVEGKLISMVSWFGLILLMFVSGLEVQGGFSKADRRFATLILLSATALPFVAGVAASSVYDFSQFLGPKGNPLSLAIIIGIAVAVTSIPVISKIFIDLRIIDTHFARIVLAVATVEDIILWAALAIATGLANELAPSLLGILSTVTITVGFLAAAIFTLPRLTRTVYSSKANVIIKSSPARYALFLCFSSVAVASLLNVNIVFGAFLPGIAIASMPGDVFGKAAKQIKTVSLAFFTPVYFAVVGLQLDLIHQFNPLFFLGFLLFSTAIKSVATLIAGKILRKDWLSTINLTVALNTRGGPGIVLATVAFNLGLINETLFTTLVLTAIITSLFAGYWLRYVLSKGWTLFHD
ncbi:MAG: cation:proton antiporter [Thaumarchaeota archaeon]|nr:cation:proton antiporter [Nitrososphaerota archaeon]MCL5318084.1 cation:proton antiporter [Nitrososphaerota archaeon]